MTDAQILAALKKRLAYVRAAPEAALAMVTGHPGIAQGDPAYAQVRSSELP